MSRSQWKFNYIGNDFKYIQEKRKENINLEYILHNRSTIIIVEMIDVVVKVYNGMRYFSFIIEKDMLGHLLGEFAPTKKKALKKKKVKIKKKGK